MTRPACRGALMLVAAALVFTAPAPGQSTADLLSAARTELENLNVDSARVLLRRVADPGQRATPAQRAVASVMNGAGALISGQNARALADFREALVLDPLVRADTLSSLHSDLVRDFENAREGPATLVVLLPSDTVVGADSGALRMDVHTSRRVLVVVTVDGGGAQPRVYEDSQMVAGSGSIDWRPDHPSRNSAAERRLRVTVRDPVADPASFAATLRIDRASADSTSWPPPLDSSGWLPESERVHGRQPRSLITGLAFGAAAAALASVGPEGPGGRDGRVFVVAGAVSLGGIVGFLKGGMLNRPIAANVAHHRELRSAWAAARDSVARTNARGRADAGVRIVVSRGAP